MEELRAERSREAWPHVGGDDWGVELAGAGLLSGEDSLWFTSAEAGDEFIAKVNAPAADSLPPGLGVVPCTDGPVIVGRGDVVRLLPDDEWEIRYIDQPDADDYWSKPSVATLRRWYVVRRRVPAEPVASKTEPRGWSECVGWMTDKGIVFEVTNSIEGGPIVKADRGNIYPDADGMVSVLVDPDNERSESGDKS